MSVRLRHQPSEGTSARRLSVEVVAMTVCTFHAAHGGPVALACDLCAALIDPSENGRHTHQQWHDTADVIDLTAREQEPADS